MTPLSKPEDLRRDRYEPSFSMSSRQLGMIVFLATLSVLFLASIIAYWVTRQNSPNWRGAELPPLPVGLWISTALLVALSVAIQGAVHAVRANRYDTLVRRLLLALTFACAFLGTQSLNWSTLLARAGLHSESLYLFTFYMLTGLHALHVIGGLPPLLITLLHARRREYTSSRYEGVRLCAQYWHFLGIVWAVLLASLLLGSK